MGMSPISADEARRLREEVERGPLFSKYPPVVDIGFAFTVALEHIEEWSHADDPDGWCHQRPILLTLAAEVERLSAEVERHRRANLVRAVIDGWDEAVDGALTDYINEHGWDAVPWKLSERLSADNARLREALALAERALRDQPMQAFQAEGARRRRAAAIDAARAALADEGDKT